MAQLAREDVKQRKVEVNRNQLVDTLIANRKKHIKEYQEAIEGYKAMALEKLQEGYEKAVKGLEKNMARAQEKIAAFDATNPRGTSDHMVLVESYTVELRVPRDYSKDYDAAIDMASWDVRETLELTHAEFQCFVRDVWDWTDDFANVSAIYNKKFGG